MDRTQVAAPAAAPQPTPGTSRATPSVYTRLGPPTDFMAETAREPPRSWRESWEFPDFRFSRPVEFVPVIQALAKILNFKPPTTTSVQEDSQFSVWATASSRTVVVPTPWESDLVIQAATKSDDRRVVKEASSFGDSTLAKFLPLSEDDEALLEVLELDNEAIVYMRSTQNPDWDPAKPFGPKVPHATKEAEKFAKVSETSAALTARLGIYIQRTQGFISGAFVEREKECQAWQAGLPPPELPSYITDDTLPGAISLANFLTAAITRVAIRQKLEASFDRRVRFMAVALSKGVVPHMAKLRLKELPLTTGTLFAGKWTTTVESTTKAQLLSVTQAQLARDQPGAGRASTDRFRIPFKKGKGSRVGQSKKGKKGGGNSSSSSEDVAAARAAEEAPKRMPTPLIIPPSHPPLSPMQNDRPGPVGGRLRSFAHLWPLVTSDKFGLETVTRGYRIEFTSKPPTTSKVWWTETPKNPSRREDLERGLQSMLDNKAVREIPVSPDTPGFYSPIFLVAKESGGWRPILNLKAFNKFVVPPSFRMETLRTVMDCLGGGGPTKAEHLRTFEGLQLILNVGDLYRFKRRLLSRGRGARAHQIPPVRLQRQSLRGPGAPLRSVDGSQSLYADRKGHRGLPQNSRGRHAPVPRRLVDEESVEIAGRAPPRLDAILGGQTGIPRERGKISTRPHSDSGLPGFDPGSPEYARVPERKENPQGYPPGGLFAGENCPAGKDLAEVSRTLVQPPRVGPHGGSPHAADPADAPRPVNAGLRQPLRAHLSERGNPRRVRMVGVAGQPSGGSTLPASKEGWGGHLGDLVLSGLWSRAWAKRHINWLEPQAVWLTLKHFLPQLQGTAVDVISDNTTTVAYINKVGGTQSPSLCRLALDVWEWCRQHEIFLVASHLSGDRNVLADALSRGTHRHPTEWTLHNAVASAIFQRWPTPHVDLFASEKNHKLPVFFSIRPSPSSSGVNALTQNWDCLYGYAYPPTSLIPRVLRKLRLQPTAQILLVAPFWPSQPWFCQMTSMLTDLPRAISQRDDLLKNAVTGMRYPKPEAMRLTVWPLSTNPSLIAAFQQMLLTRQPEPDENQLAGFMVPVLNTTKDGVWTEVWTPLKRL